MSTLADFLVAQTWAFVLAATLLGLVVGSFLNVVIHRLPLMMEREWRAQCRELSGETVEGEPDAPFESYQEHL